MVALMAKRNHEEITNGTEDENDVVARTPITPKKAASAIKTAKTNTSKKRRTSAQAPPPTQKNTLDGWFTYAKKKTSTPTPAPKDEVDESENAPAKDVSDSAQDMQVEDSPVKRTLTQKIFKGKLPSKIMGKGKKLVQRPIFLSDQCRVCESAKTERSTRCERKCMECDMTVHTSCYGVEDDDLLPEKWRCRPCQATFDLTEENPEADSHEYDEEDEDTTTIRGIPVHEPRGEGDRYYGLYDCSDFAAVFLFLKRFRRLGLKLGTDITVDTLAAALLAPRDHTLLYELHMRLLQNIGATIAKNGNWVDNVMRFLNSSDYAVGGELVQRLAACGNANDWLETYYDVAVGERVAMLKVLCEAQFDENDTLMEKLGDTDMAPESLREEVLGVDASQRIYYLLEDPSNFSHGSAWLCRCHCVNGSQWETVADDLTSLQSFVLALSYSAETLDLQLWQAIAHGVAKSLERREKKKRQQSQRLARVPRMLRSTGLDMASILPADGPATATGRSLRTRRAVSYRTYESEEDDEETSNGEEHDDEEDEEEDEEDEDEEVEMEENGRHQNRTRWRVDRAMERPTRSSRRLHGSPRRDEESDRSDVVKEGEEDDENEGGAGAQDVGDGSDDSE